MSSGVNPTQPPDKSSIDQASEPEAKCDARFLCQKARKLKKTWVDFHETWEIWISDELIILEC